MHVPLELYACSTGCVFLACVVVLSSQQVFLSSLSNEQTQTRSLITMLDLIRVFELSLFVVQLFQVPPTDLCSLALRL